MFLLVLWHNTTGEIGPLIKAYFFQNLFIVQTQYTRGFRNFSTPRQSNIQWFLWTLGRSQDNLINWSQDVSFNDLFAVPCFLALGSKLPLISTKYLKMPDIWYVLNDACTW